MFELIDAITTAEHRDAVAGVRVTFPDNSELRKPKSNLETQS